MITPNGGVFGRNPKFQNVTVENNLTVNGDFTLGDDITVTDTLTVNGITTVANTTESTAAANGALVVAGGVGIAKRLNVTGATGIAGITTVSNTTASTSTTTGALVVSGGLGVGGAIYPGGNVVMASGNGISFAATSDPSIPAVAATGVITRTATNVANNDTVTIGTTVYTFKTALTPADYEVLIGADSSASLTNLRHAILGTGGTPGTDYQVPAAHPTVTAGAIVSTTLPLTAITAGTAGNSIALAETSAQLSVTAATLQGGADAAGATSEILSDYEEGTWTPGLAFGGNSVGMVITSKVGTYIKVGRAVHVYCRFSVTSKGTSTGGASITGLPYTNLGNRFPSVLVSALIGVANGVRAYFDSLTTTAQLYSIDDSGAFAFIDHTAAVTGNYELNGTYFVA